MKAGSDVRSVRARHRNVHRFRKEKKSRRSARPLEAVEEDGYNVSTEEVEMELTQMQRKAHWLRRHVYHS